MVEHKAKQVGFDKPSCCFWGSETGLANLTILHAPIEEMKVKRKKSTNSNIKTWTVLCSENIHSKAFFDNLFWKPKSLQL